MTQVLLECPAPAKINLFLHVVGRREDGYHLLQTAFRMLDWGDRLDFHVRSDGRVRRVNDVPGVPAADDLVVRAAGALQQATGVDRGVDIEVTKVLPMGGGLGGGSSDAATTLIALNRLWETGLDRHQLESLALPLGADVPFFVYGRTAFAEGVGERFSPIHLAPCWYVVVAPGVHVPTPEIFRAKELTRDTKPIKISDFAMSATHNDLERVAIERYPQIADAVEWLGQFGPARMTGSGACIFSAFDSEQAARDVVRQCPDRWQAWAAKSLDVHPMHGWVG